MPGYPPIAADEHASLFCPECGYDLRGSDSPRCPECGSGVDRRTLAQNQLPWSHRRQIGRIRAYWRMLSLAGRPRQLAAHASRPVSYADAQRFRIVTIVLAYIPLAAAGLVLWWTITQHPLMRPGQTYSVLYAPGDWRTGFDLALPLLAAYTWWPVALLAPLLMLIGVTGAASFFFHPRSLPIVQQNRLVALSYYTCAPLAITGLSALLLAGGFVMVWSDASQLSNQQFQFFAILMIAGWGLFAGQLFVMYYVSIRLMALSTHAGAGATIAMMLLLPVLWVVIIALTMGAVPWCIGFVRLMIQSLL